MTRPSMLIAYDAAGEVVATLDFLVLMGPKGDPYGTVDFEAHELAGGEMTDVWVVEHASGSKTWPEWIGMRAHDFRIELEGPPGHKRIAALVHKGTGVRRQRADIERAVEDRIRSAEPGKAPDVTDIIGAPARPLRLDGQGKTVPRGPSRRPRDLPVHEDKATVWGAVSGPRTIPFPSNAR